MKLSLNYKPERPGAVLLRDDSAGRWLLFERPLETLCADRPEEVMPLLLQLDAAGARNLYAAGFIAYEAAAAFDPAFQTHRPKPGLPLAWFGLYKAPQPVELPDPDEAPARRSHAVWRPDVTPAMYRSAFERIRDYIAAGDTYQVNYTFRLQARLEEDPWQLFLRLQQAQRAPYGAWLNTGDTVICSASPELFFQLKGKDIECRPMKGTAKRGFGTEDDDARGESLRTSKKDRAENVMIVDMIRNDLGRIAVPGSVEVVSLFDVQRFPTLWQMTSTVRASTSAPASEIMQALFPCSSITGAPKVRTMEIIKDLEAAPRGIYTGCIGFVAPGRQAQFNVAIRTAHVALPVKDAEYGTGGGIVWDSTVDGEYEECLTKAAILCEPAQSFQLLETMRWQPDKGYLFEDLHIRRVLKSARYFQFALEEPLIRARLKTAAAAFQDAPMRVRLLCASNGEWTIESAPTDVLFHEKPTDGEALRWSVAFAPRPVSSACRFLYHKTTQRDIYDDAKREVPDADDVLLRNERNEITESTMANVVALLDGEWLTPPVRCGLLDGVFRRHLLDQRLIREQVLFERDLRRAESLYAINSVRGWIPCKWR